MQIVIDIPDSLYENILICWEKIHPKVWEILKNGKPLPKGHGRLIDADELKKHKHHDERFYENVVAVAQIDWAETIIEADKEIQNG